MTTAEFAKSIAIPFSQLYRLSLRSARCYQTYYKRKSNGERREISAPNQELKGIQRWILQNILSDYNFSPCVNGFVGRRSIKTNALPHVSKRIVACLDIKDFFPSITRNMVSDSFLSIVKDSETAELLTGLCTLQGRLPQGAVTSPALSNICFAPMDQKISDLCDSMRVTYTRYADDLTFSGDNFERINSILKGIPQILRSQGFIINGAKTRVMTGKGPLIVTGLRINQGTPSIGRRTKRILRSQLHHFIFHPNQVDEPRMLGMMSFLRSIEPSTYRSLVQYTKRLKGRASR